MAQEGLTGKKSEFSKTLTAVVERVDWRWSGYYLRTKAMVAQVVENRRLKLFKDLSSQGFDGWKGKTVCTAVYGDITLSNFCTFLLDLPWVQRLHNISQTGLLYMVYPDARHSRFDHTLGVMHNVLLVLSRSPLGQKLSDGSTDEIRAANIASVNSLLAAAALHDIGHGPYSHYSESWLKALYDGRVPPAIQDGPPKGIDETTYSRAALHERQGVQLLGDCALLQEVVKNGLHLRGRDDEQYQGFSAVLGDLKIRWDLVTVQKMIVGDTDGCPLAPIINGPFDADKFDYTQRDAFFTGAPGNGLDADYLTRTVELTGELITWPQKALNNIIYAIFSRQHFYALSVFHPVTRLANSMLSVVFYESIRFARHLLASEPDVLDRFMKHLLFMEDADIWTLADAVSACGNTGDKTLDEAQMVVTSLLDRLRTRDLFKRFKPMTAERAKELGLSGEGTRDKDVSGPLFPFAYVVKNGSVFSMDWSPDMETTWADLPDKIRKRNSVWIRTSDTGTSVLDVWELIGQSADKSDKEAAKALEKGVEILEKGVAIYQRINSYCQMASSDPDISEQTVVESLFSASDQRTYLPERLTPGS